MAFREPREDEARLLWFLARSAEPELPEKWLTELVVEEMDDGGMGSLSLLHRKTPSMDRSYFKTLSACQFADSDGVAVIASLYANREGTPIELDVWKVDFSPLLAIPDRFTALDERDIPPREPQ